jgi:hypothetical protein
MKLFIRNTTGSTDQNAFTGSIITNDIVFSSDYSAKFWGILALSFEEICQFITLNTRVQKTLKADPLSIMSRLEALNKEKTVADEGNDSFQISPPRRNGSL